MHRRLILLCAAALLAQPAPAQTPADSARATATRSVRAARVAGSIEIDGRLDEAAWVAAEAAANFTQSYPNAGAPPTERTEARVLYSDDAIYVGVRMFDSRPTPSRRNWPGATPAGSTRTGCTWRWTRTTTAAPASASR